jgi:hypothetical protein
MLRLFAELRPHGFHVAIRQRTIDAVHRVIRATSMRFIVVVPTPAAGVVFRVKQPVPFDEFDVPVAEQHIVFFSVAADLGVRGNEVAVSTWSVAESDLVLPRFGGQGMCEGVNWGAHP